MLDDVAAVARIDEIGDAREEALSRRRGERPVAGVGEQQVEVAGRRIGAVPFVAAELGRPEVTRAIHFLAVAGNRSRGWLAEAGRGSRVPALIAGLDFIEEGSGPPGDVVRGDGGQRATR